MFFSLLGESAEEVAALIALHDHGDGSAGVLARLGEVVDGVLHAILALLGGGALADPGEDLDASIDNEHVITVELVAGDIGVLGDLGELERAGGVAETEEDLLGGLLLEGCVVAALLSGLVGRDANELLPVLGEVGDGLALLEDNGLALAETLVLDGLADLSGLSALAGSGLAAVELVKGEAHIEDKDVAAVDAVLGEGDLHKAHVTLALELEEAGLVLGGLHVVEARVDAASHDADALGEVALEELGLEALDLTVLHGAAAEVLVELHGLVGCGAHLVLGRLLAEPEVDIPLEGVAAGALVGVEDDVGITAVEAAVGVLGDGDDIELLDTPDEETDLRAGLLPNECGSLFARHFFELY